MSVRRAHVKFSDKGAARGRLEKAAVSDAKRGGGSRPACNVQSGKGCVLRGAALFKNYHSKSMTWPLMVSILGF